MRLCVYLVHLCDFAHFDCSTFYFADDFWHSSRYCTPIVRFLKLVSQFFCYLDLRNAVQQISCGDVSIFFTKCGLVYDFNPVRAEQII